MPTSRTALPLFDELRGQRISVRPYRLDDAQALMAAVAESREHVRPWLPFADAHQTVEESRDWIIQGMAAWLVRDELRLSLWELGTDRFLGGIGLPPHNWDSGYFAIGYWLRRSAEGHGYMQEAVRLLADFAFDQLAANRVEIRGEARNRRSAAVAERLGFVREAQLRSHLRAPDGTLRDTLVYALTPDDARWPQQALLILPDLRPSRDALRNIGGGGGTPLDHRGEPGGGQGGGRARPL